MTQSPDGQGGFTTGHSTYSNDVFYLSNSRTSSARRVVQMDFKYQMSNYFSDYDKLKNMILNKELRYRDLEIIVETYNKWKREQKPGL